MIVGCKKPIITVVYLLSFFTFTLTIGFHVACSCNRECAHPLEAWQSKLTSLLFFLAFFEPKKKKKKGKTQRPENFYMIDTKLLFISIFSEHNILMLMNKI
jgi:hypothetical protein